MLDENTDELFAALGVETGDPSGEGEFDFLNMFEAPRGASQAANSIPKTQAAPKSMEAKSPAKPAPPPSNPFGTTTKHDSFSMSPLQPKLSFPAPASSDMFGTNKPQPSLLNPRSKPTADPFA